MVRILVLLTLTAFLGHSEPNCDQESLRKEVIMGLSDPNFYFLKTFPATRKGEVSYVFTKGSTYMITLCSHASTLTVKLSDNERRVKVDTNSATTENHIYKIIYECQATGIYYITFSNNQEECTTCGLAFKKQS